VDSGVSLNLSLSCVIKLHQTLENNNHEMTTHRIKVPRSSISSLLLLVFIGFFTILSTRLNANETFSIVVASLTAEAEYSYYVGASSNKNASPANITTAAAAKQLSASELSSFTLVVPERSNEPSQNPLKRNSNNNNNNKPNLILHIGPSKTATTTIHRRLTGKGMLLREKDNYHVLGQEIRTVGEVAEKAQAAIYRKLMQLQWTCWNKEEPLLLSTDDDDDSNNSSTVGKNSTTDDHDDHHSITSSLLLPSIRTEPCWIKLTGHLDELRETNQSIIISDEAMSHGAKRFMYKKNKQKFSLFARELQERWNVRIVIVYRRYYEWMLSAFKEQNAKILYKNRKWPVKGGKPLRHAWPTLKHWMKDADSIVDGFHYQYPDRTRKLWGRAGFQNIDIVNFHSPRGGDDDPNGLFRHFICDVVPNATHTCQDVSLSDGGDVHANARELDTTIYDHIVCEAKQRFPTNTTTTIDGDSGTTTTITSTQASAILSSTRRGAVKTLQEYHQGLGRSWIDLPLKCPTAMELEGLLNISLAKEKDLLPDFFRDREDEHRSSFWRVANEKKAFCSVDLESLFRNKDSWQDVLDSL
jgi:hypothetical protein